MGPAPEAYSSDSSGQPDVYLRSLDGSGNPTRVSVEQGWEPRWSPDGRTLYFRTRDRMMAVSVEPGADFEVGLPREAFELDETVFGKLPMYPDGTRFLANRANPELRKHFGIRVVFRWADHLEALQP